MYTAAVSQGSCLDACNHDLIKHVKGLSILHLAEHMMLLQMQPAQVQGSGKAQTRGNSIAESHCTGQRMQALGQHLNSALAFTPQMLAMECAMTTAR